MQVDIKVEVSSDTQWVIMFIIGLLQWITPIILFIWPEIMKKLDNGANKKAPAKRRRGKRKR